MGEALSVSALRRELLSTGSASADVATLTMTPEQWRSAARRIARAEGRTVRTFAGATLHAVLTDWPANDTEERVHALGLRRGVEHDPRDGERNAGVLRALSTALQEVETVMGILCSSADEEAAVLSLRERFSWDVEQANAVLGLQFKRVIREHCAAVHRQAGTN